MRTTMRGLAFLGNARVGLVERPVPIAGPGGAVVRTTASLLRTSDVHTVGGAIPMPAGRLLGHESVGVVHEIGPGGHLGSRRPASCGQRRHTRRHLRRLSSRFQLAVRRPAGRLSIHVAEGRHS
jgi:threonine dehydrogenase-like Zn-dependent dehydrogenase